MTLEAQPLWHSLVSGSAGGAAAVLVGHPFDTIKTRLQTGRRDRIFRFLYRGVSARLAVTRLLRGRDAQLERGFGTLSLDLDGHLSLLHGDVSLLQGKLGACKLSCREFSLLFRRREREAGDVAAAVQDGLGEERHIFGAHAGQRRHLGARIEEGVGEGRTTRARRHLRSLHASTLRHRLAYV